MNPGFVRGKINFEAAIPFLFLVFALNGSAGLAAQSPDQGDSKTTQSTQANDQSTKEIEAVPNRPTFSSIAETVQKGVFEIEYGLELAQGHQNINGLLKFGLLKNLEMHFANNPIVRNDGVTGRDDSGAGFKFRFFEQKRSSPTISLLYMMTIPTATANLGLGAAGHSVGLLFSKDVGKHHVDFNESIQWLPRYPVGGFDRNYFTAIDYSHPIAGKLGFAEELAGFSHTDGTAATLTILQTLTYNVSPRFVLDSGFYIAAAGDLPRVTFFSGMTYAVGDLYRHLKNTKH